MIDFVLKTLCFQDGTIVKAMLKDSTNDYGKKLKKVFKKDIEDKVKFLKQSCIGLQCKNVYKEAMARVFAENGLLTKNVQGLQDTIKSKSNNLAESMFETRYRKFDKLNAPEKVVPGNKDMFTGLDNEDMKTFIEKTTQEKPKTSKGTEKIKELKSNRELRQRNLYHKIMPSKISKWLEANKAGVKIGFKILAGVLDTIAIGEGIYDIVSGTAKIQGSGTITDRLNEQADLIDTSLVGILSMYENITDVSIDDIFDSSYATDNDYILTGMEVLGCNKYHAGTTYGLQAQVWIDDKFSCMTEDLASHKNLQRKEWKDYSGTVLGNCSSTFLPYLNKKVKCHIKKVSFFSNQFEIIILAGKCYVDVRKSGDRFNLH